jgi:hypothetical protein
MRGDQLVRQARVIRPIEASPNEFTVTEIAQREARQATGFPLYTERVDRANHWTFIDTFKFKIPSFLSHKPQKSPTNIVKSLVSYIEFWSLAGKILRKKIFASLRKWALGLEGKRNGKTKLLARSFHRRHLAGI